MQRLAGRFLGRLMGLLLLLLSEPGRAQIRQPGNHPRYTLELEPHLAIGLTNPPGDGRGDGIGPGIRFGIPLSHDGFLPRLNDSVALGLGVDWVFYDGDDRVRARCGRFVEAPNDTLVCVELGNAAGASDYLYFPAVMQWNFWLHRHVSVFAEPGIALHWARFGHDSDFGAGPVIGFGARFHLADWVAITLRLGYPASSLGVSLLL